MRVLGVVLEFPSQSDLNLVPLFVVAGALVGGLIRHFAGGHGAHVTAIAVASGVAALLAAAGADLDRGGWRGALLCLLGAVAGFGLTLALAPA